MKFSTVLLCGLFSLYRLSALGQTIEVVVEHQVSLKALDYVYIVGVDEDFSDLSSVLRNLELESDEDEEQEDVLTLDELESTLKQQKFSSERVKRRLYLMEDESEVLLVKLASEAELNRLKALVETMEGAIGGVESANFEDKSVHMERIYPLMFADAKKEAEVMARVTGKTVGSLLAVQESSAASNPWTDLLEGYGLMLEEVGLSSELGSRAIKKEVEFRYMFRFELK